VAGVEPFGAAATRDALRAPGAIWARFGGRADEVLRGFAGPVARDARAGALGAGASAFCVSTSAIFGLRVDWVRAAGAIGRDSLGGRGKKKRGADLMCFSPPQTRAAGGVESNPGAQVDQLTNMKLSREGPVGLTSYDICDCRRFLLRQR
jgi:hypothetical protein